MDQYSTTLLNVDGNDDSTLQFWQQLIYCYYNRRVGSYILIML